MKILILTFSKGINPGTFMQAYGVQYGMQKTFPDASVEFLDFDDFKTNKVTKNIRRSLVTLFLQKTYAAIRLINYTKHYRETFNLTKEKIDIFNYDIKVLNSIIERYDLLVIGSDTILEDAISSTNQIGVNWGPKQLSIKKIFFAASASPARFDLTDTIKNKLKENIEAFSFVGIRDNLTINYFTKELGVLPESIIKQPDPTFLLDLKEFKLPKYYQKKLQGKKVALCNFNINFPYRKEVSKILKTKGYTLISTFYNPYVDIQIATVNAFGWAAVFEYCDLVVTERFHDSVFALRNCKPIIAVDWDKERFSESGDSKTYRILSDYELEDFHVNIQDQYGIEIITEKINKLDLFDVDKVKTFNTKYQNLANSYLNEIQIKINQK